MALKLSSFPEHIAKKLAVEFVEDDGNSEVDEIEVDEANNVVAVGHRCTKENCQCVGGWWQNTGIRPVGDTVIVSA